MSLGDIFHTTVMVAVIVVVVVVVVVIASTAAIREVHGHGFGHSRSENIGRVLSWLGQTGIMHRSIGLFQFHSRGGDGGGTGNHGSSRRIPR